jgi:hypothetical protein
MKIAVISSHPIGLEFANYLNAIGADVVLFAPFKQTNNEVKIINEQLLWIQKKAISLEELSGKDRMKDLFRVVYEVKPDPSSLSDSYSNDLQESLKKELDYFVDVDGVVSFEDKALGVNYTHPSGAPSLGELKLTSHAAIRYEQSELVLPQIGEVAFIGESYNSLKALKKICHWIDTDSEKKRRVFWISHKSNPWETITDKDLLNFRAKFDQQFEEQVSIFLEKNKSWQELEDYEKVKWPKPKEPIPQLVIFAGHHVTAIDVLLNSEKIYITLERSNLTTVTIQKENAQRELKTISADQFLVYNGLKYQRTWESYLRVDEPGFLTFHSKDLSLEEVITNFESNFLIFFKRQ